MDALGEVPVKVASLLMLEGDIFVTSPGDDAGTWCQCHHLILSRPATYWWLGSTEVSTFSGGFTIR